MTIFLTIMFAIMWINLGVFAARAMNELDGVTPLDTLIIPLRLAVILLAPIMFLVYERHLFYSKAVPMDKSIEP